MKVKLIRPHREGCTAVLNWPSDPWAGFFEPGSYYKFERIPSVLLLDALGRRHKKNAHRRWLTVFCNSTDCPGVVAVKEDDVTAAIQAALEAQNGAE